MAANFEVNSEPHTGARPSVCLCVGLIISFKLGVDFKTTAIEVPL
jgi:hypothetical protein